MDEDKIIDKIIEILELMNNYAPTSSFPANPALPIIRLKVERLKLVRNLTTKKFKLHFDNISRITKQISDVKL